MEFYQDDVEDDVEDEKYHVPTEFTVFLVDASAPARKPCGMEGVKGVRPTDTWLDVALLFLASYMKHKILTSPGDEAAVVFYGAVPVSLPGGGGDAAGPQPPPPPSGTAATTHAPPPPPAPEPDPVSVFQDLGPTSAARVRALATLTRCGDAGALEAAAGGRPLSGPAAADAAVAGLAMAAAIFGGKVPASGRGGRGGGVPMATGEAGTRMAGFVGGDAPPPGRAGTLRRGLRRVRVLTADALASATATAKARAVDRAGQASDVHIGFQLIALNAGAAGSERTGDGGGGGDGLTGGGVLGPRALRSASAPEAVPFWSAVTRRWAAGPSADAAKAGPVGAPGAGARTTQLPADSPAGGGPRPAPTAPTQAPPSGSAPPPGGTAAGAPTAASAAGTDDLPSDDEGMADPWSALLALRDLEGAARVAAYRRRSLGAFDVRLPGGARFGVRLYASVRRAALSTAGWLAVDSLAPVEAVTKGLDAAGEPIPLRGPSARGGGERGGGGVPGPPRASAAAGRKPKAGAPPDTPDGPGLFCGAAAPPRHRVVASAAEVAALRDGGPRGFTVLGWVDARTAARPRHAMRPPSFLYPTPDTDTDDAPIPGGRAAAVALHAAMLGDDEGGGGDGGGSPPRAALASFVRVPGTPARLVALLARREEIDVDSGAQLSPPGFDVVYLPWADDARHPETAPTVVGFPPFLPPPDDAAAAADDFVAVLRRAGRVGPYEPVPNPVLQRQYDILASLALGESLAAADLLGGGGSGGGGGGEEEGACGGCGTEKAGPSGAAAVADATLPAPWATGGSRSAVEAAAVALLEAAGAPTRPGGAKKATGVKRAAAGGGDSPRGTTPPGAGAPPSRGGSASLEDPGHAAALAAGRGDKLTVPQLKALARARGLPVGGKKADLLERLVGVGGGGGSGGGGPATTLPGVGACQSRLGPEFSRGGGAFSPVGAGSAVAASAAVSPSHAAGGSPPSRGGTARAPPRSRRGSAPPPGGMPVEPSQDSF